ncbi:alpha-amylase family glycosyl hydrolase [Nafulsella turpanensis]|uniref:alpha-amylase family glycosyl hydrolase n=1 Tax=Nafulsella turpanensis TaxID=1265690 RepID=UPI000345CDC7|nr:alpha-amylase family glycosyl hydrolase [Nafulsella turpanensis]
MLKTSILLAATGILALSACKNQSAESVNQEKATPVAALTEDVSQWPNAVTYEIFVQSFADSNNDGIGDIKGMTGKLDYLEDLGVKAIWLMPINPSPSYHKYDVTDYYGIHPDYGSMEDFKEFVDEAHSRGLKVIMDLVVNHTGRDHPWFQSAVKNPDSPYRDYYVWADKDSIADQIAKKEITLDSDNITQWHEAPGNSQSYYGFFWGGMPDLNFDNPEVKEEIFKIGRYWLEEVGVDGFRLDAARHIFPDDRPEDNHAWWQEFRAEMEKVKPDVYLVGEVWDSTEKVAPYLKGLHALFNFDMSYAITEAVAEGDADSLVVKHKAIRDFYSRVTDDFIDAIFLTNHDQNRIMSALEADPEKAKMAAALLFTLPGSPYIYYGEEIGMLGKKPDEHIREPFLWKPKKEDALRASWIEPTYSTDTSVQALSVQKNNPESMYNHYKNLIALRNSSPALTFGSLEEAHTKVPELVAFRRMSQGEDLLILHNLSGEAKQFSLSGPDLEYDQLFFTSEADASREMDKVSLPKYSTVILKKD